MCVHVILTEISCVLQTKLVNSQGNYPEQKSDVKKGSRGALPVFGTKNRCNLIFLSIRVFNYKTLNLTF